VIATGARHGYFGRGRMASTPRHQEIDDATASDANICLPCGTRQTIRQESLPDTTNILTFSCGRRRTHGRGDGGRNAKNGPAHATDMAFRLLPAVFRVMLAKRVRPAAAFPEKNWETRPQGVNGLACRQVECA